MGRGDVLVMTALYRRLFAEPSPGEPTTEMTVLGSESEAQVVLPLESKAALAAALTRNHAGMGTGERMARSGAAVLARLGVLQPFLRSRILVARREPPDEPGIHAELERILGTEPLMLAVAFGPPRPNRKPVIRALDQSGRTVAFAKIGWDPLTESLVEAEVANLSNPHVHQLSEVTAPEVIHDGFWRGHRLAVFSAELGRRGRARPSANVFYEVAALWDHSVETIGESSFAAGLRARVASGSVDTDRTRNIVDDILDRWGQVEVEMGGWHGDWTPWNTAARGHGGFVLWDWERAGPGAPVGFDAIHYRFQPRLRSLPTSPVELLNVTTMWAAEAGIRHPREVAACYLLSISIRHSAYSTSPGEHAIGYLDVLAELRG